jgi:hypothetical protein
MLKGMHAQKSGAIHRLFLLRVYILRGYMSIQQSMIFICFGKKAQILQANILQADCLNLFIGCDHLK